MAISNPAPATNFPQENDSFPKPRTDRAQVFTSRRRELKFPQTIPFRKAEVKIYGKKPATPYYRLCWYVNGKRLTSQFKDYKTAKEEAERKVREISKGSTSTALTPSQNRDALAALDALTEYKHSTWCGETLLQAVSTYVQAMKSLGGRPLRDAVAGYLRTVAVVQPKDLQEAVSEYCDSTSKRVTKRFAQQRKIRLGKFSETFQNTIVSDLSRSHVDLFFQNLDLAPKTRNHYRADLKAFFDWCVKKDYLTSHHRLNDAEQIHSEPIRDEEVKFYKPSEFKKILEKSDSRILPLIAIAGLAGLRTNELMGIKWEHIWREDDNIEITKGVAKNRYRRLVPICPSLAAILEPYKGIEGKVWPISYKQYQRDVQNIFKSAKVSTIRNGLRHSFSSYHFELHGDEKLTSKISGNSPAMLYKHYRGVARKSEAKAWFDSSL